MGGFDRGLMHVFFSVKLVVSEMRSGEFFNVAFQGRFEWIIDLVG